MESEKSEKEKADAEFLDSFYSGKIAFKLPKTFPENFATRPTYIKDGKEIPLQNKKAVETILKQAYEKIQPILRKFKLSLALLVECEVESSKVAWTKKIKIDFSRYTKDGKKDPLFAYTQMVRMKIRSTENPNDTSKFMNKTTLYAILLHELAHLRHMNHNVEFGLFLKEIYEYGNSLGIFPDGEEHQIPSIREWERRIFETKGKVSEEEIKEIFEKLGPEDKKGENNDDDKNEETKQDIKEEKQNKAINSKFRTKMNMGNNFSPDFELVEKK